MKAEYILILALAHCSVVQWKANRKYAVLTPSETHQCRSKLSALELGIQLSNK